MTRTYFFLVAALFWLVLTILYTVFFASGDMSGDQTTTIYAASTVSLLALFALNKMAYSLKRGGRQPRNAGRGRDGGDQGVRLKALFFSLLFSGLCACDTAGQASVGGTTLEVESIAKVADTCAQPWIKKHRAFEALQQTGFIQTSAHNATTVANALANNPVFFGLNDRTVAELNDVLSKTPAGIRQIRSPLWDPKSNNFVLSVDYDGWLAADGNGTLLLAQWQGVEMNTRYLNRLTCVLLSSDEDLSNVTTSRLMRLLNMAKLDRRIQHEFGSASYSVTDVDRNGVRGASEFTVLSFKPAPTTSPIVHQGWKPMKSALLIISNSVELK